MTQEDDALTQSWDIASEKGTRVFMNPPYGREIGKWVKKAFEESLKGTLVVCLIPSRTDTKWWHAYCMKASHIIFLRGRVKFEQNGKTGTVSAPFPSCLVIFRGRDEDNLDNPPVIGSMGA
jgi:site-specific DNA-methyltransferase (adenine-specific)